MIKYSIIGIGYLIAYMIRIILMVSLLAIMIIIIDVLASRYLIVRGIVVGIIGILYALVSLFLLVSFMVVAYFEGKDIYNKKLKRGGEGK